MLVRSHVRLALLGSLLSLTSVSAFITPAISRVSVKSMRSAVASQPKISMKKGSASMAAELPVAELPRGAERPKLVVFDLDNTMWTPELYQLKRSPKAGRDVYLFPGTIAALHELATLAEWKGTAVAFASRTNKVAWAEDLITRFEVADSVTMASLAKYKEIYPGSKRKHFEKLKADSGIPFSDMIFFDDATMNTREIEKMGVLCVFCPKGLSTAVWEHGLAEYAKLKAENCDWMGKTLSLAGGTSRRAAAAVRRGPAPRKRKTGMGAGAEPGAFSEGELSEELAVPLEQVGRVIGRQGKTIRRLEAESGASLRVFDAELSRGASDGPARVVISGAADAIAVAKERILAIVSG